MWVKKTEKELMYEERNRNVQKVKYWCGIKVTSIIEFIFIFAIAFFLLLLFQIIMAVTFGENINRQPYLPATSFPDKVRVPISDIPQILPSYLFASSLTGFFLATVFFFIGRAMASDKRKGTTTTTQVCTKCNKVKADDGIYIYDCGGEYILITKIKWVEPEKK